MDRRKFLKRPGLGAAAVAVGAELCGPLCSSWCTEHAMPPAQHVGSYDEYASFSRVALEKDWDDMIEQCAQELGRRAGESVAALQNQFVASLG